MDKREENPRWKDPEKAQLSSPEALSALDASPEAIGTGAVAGWFGDVPDYYYRVGVEEWQLPFFCLRGLKVRDLDRFLQMMGEEPTGWPPSSCTRTARSAARPRRTM